MDDGGSIKFYVSDVILGWLVNVIDLYAMRYVNVFAQMLDGILCVL